VLHQHLSHKGGQINDFAKRMDPSGSEPTAAKAKNVSLIVTSKFTLAKAKGESKVG
jgi:hypothetical protein